MKERIIREIQKLADENGNVPGYRNLTGDTDITIHDIRREFDSWGNAVVEAGFPRPPKAAESKNPGNDVLWELYYGEQLSVIDIGQKYNVENQTVRRWLRESGLEVITPKEIRKIIYEGRVHKDDISVRLETLRNYPIITDGDYYIFDG